MVDPFSPLPSPQPALPRPRGATSSRCAVGLTALLTAVLTLFTGSPVLAGLSGDLDPTFSTNGWHVFDWNASTGPSYGRDLAVQADGKSVVVGSFNESGDKGGIARLTTTGTLDTTFSGDGLATLTSGGCEVELNAVAIQSSGRILVGGRCGDYFLIARYTTAGVLDTTFAPGTGGAASIIDPDWLGQVNDIEISPSTGQIAWIGSASQSSTNGSFRILVTDANGNLDSSFGTGGIQTRTFPGYDEVEGLAGTWAKSGLWTVGAGKTISTLNPCGNATAGQEVGLYVKFDLDGNAGSPLGSLLLPEACFKGSARFEDVAVRPLTEEPIFVAGVIDTGSANRDFAIARFDLNGDLDTNWSGDGVTTVDFNGYSDHAYSIILDGDPGDLNPKVIAVGEAQGFYLLSANADVGIVRLDENGNLDSTFNTDGRASTHLTYFGGQLFVQGNERGKAAKLQADGRLLVVGENSFGTYDTLIARYWANECGDGVLEPGEACDDGNTDDGDCCSSSCEFESAGSACDNGIFCDGTDTCDGAGSCADSSGDPCVGNVGDADFDCSESCNESTDSCTATDPNGSACSDGLFCNGVEQCSNGACGFSSGDPCAGNIGDADFDCSESCNETSDQCTNNDPAGSACGSGASSACDAADTCDGSGTCDPNYATAGTSCGSSTSGVCDAADTCDGSGTCDPNYASTATPCRGSQGACDIEEFCDGAGTCPTDAKSTGVCQAASGLCDIAEVCDGVSNDCPTDDAIEPAGTVCRAAAGVCDIADVCDGTSKDCTDQFVAAGTECRPSTGICDEAEACTGSAPNCPDDVVHPDSDGDGYPDICDNCENLANPGQQDTDTDGVGDDCDNCPSVCNPDQTDSDGATCVPGDGVDDVYCGDNNGGDACDACPDLNQDDASHCTSGTPCCDPLMSAAGSFDPGGPACSLSPTTETLETPDGSATLTVPPGAVDEPTTISITGLDRGSSPPAGRELFLKQGGGTVHTGLLLEPEGHIFDPYLTLCLQWEDANDDGVIDGTSLQERKMRVLTKNVPTDENSASREICGKCDYQTDHRCREIDPATGIPTTDLGLQGGVLVDGYGTKADTYTSCSGGVRHGLACTDDTDCVGDPNTNVPDGTCETLRCCCDLDYDRYCLEIAHFSAYGIGEIDCAPVSRPQVLLLKLDKPAGEHKAKIAGNIQLPNPIAPDLDPLLNGVRLAVRDSAGNAVIDVDIPGGAFDKATKAGWKRNAKGNVFKWMNKAGIDGIFKVLLKEGSPKNPGLIKFIVIGKGGAYGVNPDDLPLSITLDLGPKYSLVNQCGEQIFEGQSGLCGSSGKAVICR